MPMVYMPSFFFEIQIRICTFVHVENFRMEGCPCDTNHQSREIHHSVFPLHILLLFFR